MRPRLIILTITLVTIIAVSLFVVVEWFNDKQRLSPDFFVGVEFAYGDVGDCKELVDKVKNYTNLFVIGALDISLNETSLNMTCDYIYDARLFFIVLFTSPSRYNYNPYVWIIKARQEYGYRFLGAFRYDEPGGNQLDLGPSLQLVEAKNYSDAAETYVKNLNIHIEYYLYSTAKLFTADYGLYWFDYKAGYDTVLAEFGWNHSRQLHVALCRGAARVQNKDWGVIVTWTYNGTPYIESGDRLYEDLILAYHSGAKYVAVFDYPNITQYGILTEEHFDALKKFWNYTHCNLEKHGIFQGEVAYVLPEDYGFGFRSPSDTIWGLWNADNWSKKMWDDVSDLLDKYGSTIDIVYGDPAFNSNIRRYYNRLLFWNETLQNNS